MLEHWDFPTGGALVDNFCGAGTTLLVGWERGLTSAGFDVSPLAVTATAAKTGQYDKSELEQGLRLVLSAPPGPAPAVPDRLARAFTPEELRQLFGLLRPVRSLPPRLRRFFLVALLSTVRGFSRAVPDGGWFRWKQWPDRSSRVREAFEDTAGVMIGDVGMGGFPRSTSVSVRRADARSLPLGSASVDGVVSSPPYANRHDYSRVFHIELLLLGMTEGQVTDLRHGTVRSHVEARPPVGFSRRLRGYHPPGMLAEALGMLPARLDGRVRRFLRGYFEDLYLTLAEVRRVLRTGGQAAYVIGNVQHAGVMIRADEIAAEVGQQAGLRFEGCWVVRTRGNAAQQMGRYGRRPSRESVVFFSKPDKAGV